MCIDKEVHFKDLVHVTVDTAKLQSVRQAGRNLVFTIWRQNFFSEKTVFALEASN